MFISYQWDSQELVIKIKEHLEKAGFNCFIDLGQLGGGNNLYQKIDLAIRNAKVVIACITPKFVVSHFCNREMALADLLRKPIVPIMLHPTPWPPPGGMSLIFSQLVYVDYFGVGGHGGCGINADRDQRNNEIVAMVSRHINPSSYFLMNIDRFNDNQEQQQNSTKSKSVLESMKSIQASMNTTGTLTRREDPLNARTLQSERNIANSNTNNNRNLNSNINRTNPANLNTSQSRRAEQANAPRCSVCSLL